MTYNFLQKKKKNPQTKNLNCLENVHIRQAINMRRKKLGIDLS